MGHVRKFQTGKHQTESQKILNEISGARVCLLNPEKKAKYDASLRKRKASAKASSVPLDMPVRPPSLPVATPLPASQALASSTVSGRERHHEQGHPGRLATQDDIRLAEIDLGFSRRVRQRQKYLLVLCLPGPDGFFHARLAALYMANLVSLQSLNLSFCERLTDLSVLENLPNLRSVVVDDRLQEFVSVKLAGKVRNQYGGVRETRHEV